MLAPGCLWVAQGPRNLKTWRTWTETVIAFATTLRLIASLKFLLMLVVCESLFFSSAQTYQGLHWASRKRCSLGYQKLTVFSCWISSWFGQLRNLELLTSAWILWSAFVALLSDQGQEFGLSWRLVPSSSSWFGLNCHLFENPMRTHHLEKQKISGHSARC